MEDNLAIPEHIGFDIRAGGLLHDTLIPPDQARVFLACWPNGARVEIMHYDNPPSRPEDCMEMIVYAHDGVPHGWYLSPEDVEALIFGLRLALDEHKKVCGD